MINNKLFEKLDRLNSLLVEKRSTKVTDISLKQYNSRVFNYLLSDDDTLIGWIASENKDNQVFLYSFIDAPLSLQVYDIITTYAAKLKKKISSYINHFPTLSNDIKINEQIASACTPYFISGDYDVDGWWSEIAKEIKDIDNYLVINARNLIDFYHYDQSILVTGDCMGLQGKIHELLRKE